MSTVEKTAARKVNSWRRLSTTITKRYGKTEKSALRSN